MTNDMYKKKIKKVMMYFFLILGAYLGIGYLLHLVIFPEKKPDISTYFKPGDVFYSAAEKAKQTVLKQENGFVYCSAVIEPFAPGPPVHIHTEFDEVFEITNGELSMLVNGEVKKIRPGQSLHVPKGTPHKPFNETADTIHTKGYIAFPEKFAFGLAQVYGLMDNDPKFGKSAGTMLQMILLNNSGFDSYLDNPPLMVQKVTGFLLTPLARLLGYKSYYKKYDVKARKQ
jgi:mannose-6-phosphate isomerase-like protein (cupin superfamily)